MHPTGLGRWDKMRKELNDIQFKQPWDRKISKGFFRGSRTSAERDDLIKLSRSRPEMIAAEYTKNQAYKSEKDILYAKQPAATVHLHDHCQYKYLFNFKGVAASFRHKHLFMCNSLVFNMRPENEKDEYLEFYYQAMYANYHYVPITSGKNAESMDPRHGRQRATNPLELQIEQQGLMDPDELTTSEEIRYTMDYFMRHDEKAQEIANRGYKFVKEKLSFKNIECYGRRF